MHQDTPGAEAIIPMRNGTFRFPEVTRLAS